MLGWHRHHIISENSSPTGDQTSAAFRITSSKQHVLNLATMRLTFIIIIVIIITGIPIPEHVLIQFNNAVPHYSFRRFAIFYDEERAGLRHQPPAWRINNDRTITTMLNGVLWKRQITRKQIRNIYLTQ
jgi:hypothetical protein